MTPGRRAANAACWAATRVVEEASHLVRRRADDHCPLELGVVSADGGTRLRHEHVAGLESDVVRDRVGPGASAADLAAIAGLDAVGRGELAVVAVPDRLEERERRLVSGAQARLRLRRARPRVLLQEAMRVLAPSRALPDQRDLDLALARHHRLDGCCERDDGRARDLAERRPLVAEDPGVAVLVGADPAADPEALEHPGEEAHRMLRAGVLGVRLDDERRLGPDPLDLELRDEHGHLAGRALREDDGPLGGEEPEVREVPDVVLVEEDVPGEPLGPNELEEPLAASLELCGRDPREGRSRLRCHLAAVLRVDLARDSLDELARRRLFRRLVRVGDELRLDRLDLLGRCRSHLRRRPTRPPDAMSSLPASAASIAPRSNRSTISRSSGESRSGLRPIFMPRA